MALPQGLVDARALMRIRSLELRARLVVEGLQRGLNRSPYHGFSVEFTEYRAYVPGDDVRFFDWRLYARTDRDYIKKFEDETNLRCHLVVDHSRSMGYGSIGWTKADCAATLAATLATFLGAQGDAVGLCTFADRMLEHLPARHRPGHLRRLCLMLEHTPAGEATSLGLPLGQISEVIRRRGLVIVLSDFLAPVDELQRRLGAMVACGHEVVLFQILDPRELSFDFDEAVLFRDMESGRTLFVDPGAARQGYRQALEAHGQAIKTACRGLGIDHHVVSSDRAPELTLLAFLGGRARRRRGRL